MLLESAHFFCLKAVTAYSFSSASTTGQNCKHHFNFKSFRLLYVFVKLYMYAMSLLNENLNTCKQFL